MTTITHGGSGVSRDTAKLPESSINALLVRGFAHLLGNEQSSKVVARIKSALAEGKPDDYEATKEEVKAFRAANGTLVSQWNDEAVKAALVALDEGTLGLHIARGPSRDPIESAMRKLAREEVTTSLKASDIKVPSGDKTVTFRAGTPQEERLTMDELIDRRISKHGDRIRKEAERKVAEAERKAKRAREETAKAGGVESELL